MSFINLLSSDVWTDTDIVNRTEAMITSEFPRVHLDILTRKVQGQSMGYVLTEQEQADLMAYSMVCYQAGVAADEARADMARLNAVMAYEQALARLDQPEVDQAAVVTFVDENGQAVEQADPGVAQDAAERAAAFALVEAADPELLTLYALRNPVPVEEPVEESPEATP